MPTLAGWIPPAFRRNVSEKKAQAAIAAQAGPTRAIPARTGFVPGIPQGGIDEHIQSVGASTGSDRGTQLEELYDCYIAVQPAWSCVQAIARTITAGGLYTDWDGDTGEGDEAPDKPPAVIALERFYAFCNPDQDIRQLLRNAIAALIVFGDALLEVVWDGPTPVALYNLDVPTTYPRADEHGVISAWVQQTDTGQTAEFEPREVIHISLDSARPGVNGISPLQAVLTPMAAWLYAAACEKEMLRKGLPMNVHMDLPASYSDDEVTRFDNRYRARNLGTKNIGAPLISKNGGKVTELQAGKLADVLAAKKDARDEIVSGCGVPPAEVGIIESGNLGGGTGDSQHRALDLNTMIPTPSGWTTMGELSIGDTVFDEAGRPCKVTGTYEVPEAKAWRLEFSDGTHIDCDEDHLWVTWTEQDRKAYGRCLYTDSSAVPENWPEWRSRRGRGPEVRRTAEVLATLNRRNGTLRGNHSIPMTGALQMPDAVLPVDPYTLGAWLGDGTHVNSSITVATGEEQILDEIRSAGYELTERPSARKPGCGLWNVGGLRGRLREIGVLGDKHVPPSYLRASAAQRLALLQGLMDTDGGFHSAGQQVVFRNTNERLADAVMELARSLGQKPVKTKGRSPVVGTGTSVPANGVDYGPSYTITFCPTIQVFRLARKAALWKVSPKTGTRLSHRFIIGATKIADTPMRCITVDSPNRMYLAGEAMIPTHNTFMINTCDPIAELLLEKLNFRIAVQGFGVQGWKSKFREVDYRDSVVVEQIRDTRIRNGTYVINKGRAEIGEPPVKGGDKPILVDRQNLVLVEDLDAMSKATVAKMAAAGAAGQAQQLPGQVPGQAAQLPQGAESAAAQRAAVREALRRYHAASEALYEDVTSAVYAQMASSFPASAISWVKDSATWTGPVRVPLDQVDMDDRDDWNASHEPGKVKKIARKMRRAAKKGRQPKPVVMVRWPGSDKDVIVDGHHHVLAAEAEGEHFVWAYVGHVDSQDGPWRTTATREQRRKKAA